jgi:precorrin-6B methylase 2
MNEMELLIDLHVRNPRQGPGSDADTLRALSLCGLEPNADLRVVDIGCGTGASTLCLARALPKARIQAVDMLPEFLEVLQRNAAEEGVDGRIGLLAMGMEDLRLPENETDLIWSEGAVYNIGFETGIRDWRRFLKPGGCLVVSEITWLTDQRPGALQRHWDTEYPEVDTASAKLAVLERNGYTPAGYFPLPVSSWMEGYYQPLRAGFAGFLERHGHSEAAEAIVKAEEAEIGLYEEYREHVSYGVYVARKR